MFKPGQSGNPGGRPKGQALVSSIRAKVGDGGEKLVEALYAIAFAKQEDIERIFGAKATLRDRLSAVQELADRGFGKVPQQLDHADSNGEPLRVVFGGRHRPDERAA